MFTINFEKTAKEKLKGGRGDHKPDKKYPKEELEDGVDHEKEHTKDKKVAKEIAKDHLEEDKKYYKKLEKIEKKGSSNIYRGLEHGGLGLLMAPSLYNLSRKKKPGVSHDEHKKERVKDVAEVAGLGTLMGAVEAGHEGSRVNKLVKRIAKRK